MISLDFAKNIRFNGRKIRNSREIVKKETILNKCHVLNIDAKNNASAMKFYRDRWTVAIELLPLNNFFINHFYVPS